MNGKGCEVELMSGLPDENRRDMPEYIEVGMELQEKSSSTMPVPRGQDGAKEPEGVLVR